VIDDSAVPPGWPPEVRPPGAPDWERTAVAWLLDQCPPEYRSEEVLRRHPVILARFASHHVAGGLEAAERGVAAARQELREVVSPDVVEAAVAAYQRAQVRLQAAGRGVHLVEQALRGRRFRPRM
jgi:hypothetical protein